MAIPAFKIWESAKYNIQDQGDIRYSLPRFCDALNEAQADFINHVDYEVKSMIADIPVNYNSLNFGDIANRIVQIEYIDPSRNYTVTLQRMSMDTLNQEYPNWKSSQVVTTPAYFVADRQNPCQFFVYPLARRNEDGEEDSGILETSDGALNITEDSGIVESIDNPYLRVVYAVLPRIVAPNADNTDILFDGTNQRAILPINYDVMHCLKHYCVSIMLSDDNDRISQGISANHLALYQRALQKIVEKKQDDFSTDVLTIPHNHGVGTGSYYHQQGHYRGDFNN